jgi:predicted nucleic acid-binding protein
MIVYLDSNIVIYAVEQNPAFSSKARTRLALARSGGDELTISDRPGWSAW